MKNANANDVAYWKFLIDEAEQFFNVRIKELEGVCINRLTESFISASVSSQLNRQLYVDSKDVIPIQTCGNEKEDPFQWRI